MQFNLMRIAMKGQGLDVELTESAQDYLAERGYEPAFGARPLKRVLQKEVVNELAKEVLEENSPRATGSSSITLTVD